MAKKKTLSLEKRFAVLELLFHFMRTFDEKDWAGMEACLTQMVYCDYSSFRGEPPAMVARENYSAKRKAALSALITQHNLSNITMAPKGKSIDVQCNFTILRFQPDFKEEKGDYFHSYGRYQFTVVRRGPIWHITSITQHILRNEGNPQLHIGAGK
jgi:nuclear transport factor 2 (NTF2) superfamily protein